MTFIEKRHHHMRLKNLGVMRYQKLGADLQSTNCLSATQQSQRYQLENWMIIQLTKINIDQAWQWAMSNPPVEQQRCPHWASVRSRGHTLRQDKQPTEEDFLKTIQCCHDGGGLFTTLNIVEHCSMNNLSWNIFPPVDSLQWICYTIQCCNGDGVL